MNKTIKFIKEGLRGYHNGYPRKQIIAYFYFYTILIAITPLLWMFIFIWIPSQSMVKIEGYVQETRSTYTSGRFNGTASYNIKLKDTNSPVYFVISRSRTIGDIKKINLKEGDYIVTHIEKKDIKRLKENFPDSLSFQECAPKYLDNLPRVYSMSINGVEKASITRALYNYPSSFLAIILQVLVVVFIFIWSINICFVVKDLKDKKKK